MVKITEMTSQYLPYICWNECIPLNNFGFYQIPSFPSPSAFATCHLNLKTYNAHFKIKIFHVHHLTAVGRLINVYHLLSVKIIMAKSLCVCYQCLILKRGKHQDFAQRPR